MAYPFTGLPRIAEGEGGGDRRSLGVIVRGTGCAVTK